MRKSRLLVILPTALLLMAEGLLWLAPLDDPYPRSTAAKFNQYLPSWNHWAWNTWGRQTPPFEIQFDPGPLRGVRPGVAVLQVNEYGFPYADEKRERTAPEELRVAVLGGSTVECVALQDGLRWPDRLEAHLEQALPSRPATVLNLGISAEPTETHVASMAQHAVRLELDVAVFMLGANDAVRTREDWRPSLNAPAFYEVGGDRPGLLQLALTRSQLVRRLMAALDGGGSEEWVPRQQPYFQAAADARRALADAPRRYEVPAQWLNDYALNVSTLAGMARQHGIEPVFTTQPMLWTANPREEDEALNWFGQVELDGEAWRIPTPQLAEVLESLNRALLEVCAREDFVCIDLDAVLGRRPEYFYDSVHFNEAGADAVAAAVSDAVVEALAAR